MTRKCVLYQDIETTMTQKIGEGVHNDDFVTAWEYASLTATNGKRIAASPDIMQARVYAGWDTIFGVLSDPTSNSQVIVNPKKNEVAIYHGDGPIKPEKIRSARGNPQKNFARVYSDGHDDSKDALVLENYIGIDGGKYYALEKLKSVKSGQYHYKDLKGNILLLFLTGNDRKLSEQYLEKIVEEQIHSFSAIRSDDDPEKIQLYNPFERASFNKPHAWILQFQSIRGIGFEPQTLYHKKGYTSATFIVETDKIITERSKGNTPNITDIHNLASKYIPPVLIQEYRKKLLELYF